MTDWSLALKIEHKVAQIITQQEINGVGFDKPKALEYVEFLQDTRSYLYKEIRPHLKKEVYVPYKTPVNKPFLKNGNYSESVHAWFSSGDTNNVSGPFTRVEFIEPELSKQAKLKEQLFKLGWEPTEWNTHKDTGERTSPKLTEDSFDTLQGELGYLIKKWLVLAHRQSQIQGWINNIRPDGRITAGANPCGANTCRMLHKTVVNVPRATIDKDTHELVWDIDKQGSIFGTQMRSLFPATEGRVLVGHDASGLEMRIFAHYLNDAALTQEILKGDFHTVVWKTVDEFIASRSDSKNFFYAGLYGASDTKLGSMAQIKPKGWSNAQIGKEMRRRLMQGIPAFGELTKNVQASSKRGYLIGLDGRRLYIRGQHSAVNTLFQGAGAIVMKLSMCYLDKWVREESLSTIKVIDMHDEAQAENIPSEAELYGELAVRSIRTAGEFLGVRCPLDGEYKIGRNWAETH